MWVEVVRVVFFQNLRSILNLRLTFDVLFSNLITHLNTLIVGMLRRQFLPLLTFPLL